MEEEINLIDGLKLMIKHKFIIISVIMIFVVIAFFYSLRIKPLFTAETTLIPQYIKIESNDDYQKIALNLDEEYQKEMMICDNNYRVILTDFEKKLAACETPEDIEKEKTILELKKEQIEARKNALIEMKDRRLKEINTEKVKKIDDIKAKKEQADFSKESVTRLIKSRFFASYVKDHNPQLNFTTNYIQSCIKDGSLEKIKAEGGKANDVVIISNAYAYSLSKYMNGYYIVLDEAGISSESRNNNIIKNCGIATLAGFFPGFLLACFYDWFRRIGFKELFVEQL